MADSYKAETMAFLGYAGDLGKKVGEAGNSYGPAAAEAAPFGGPGLGTGGARDFKALYAQAHRAHQAFFGEAAMGTGLLGSGAMSIGINYANGDTDMSTHMKQAMVELFNPPAGAPTVRTAKPATSDGSGTDAGPGQGAVPGAAPGTTGATSTTGSGSGGTSPMASHIRQLHNAQLTAQGQTTQFLTGSTDAKPGEKSDPSKMTNEELATQSVNEAATEAHNSQTTHSDDWKGSDSEPYAPTDPNWEGKPVVTQFDDPANEKLLRTPVPGSGPLPQ